VKCAASSGKGATGAGAVLLAVLALGACTTAPPSGPSLAAAPGKGKSVAALRQDDTDCRHAAAQQINAEPQPKAAGGTPQQRYDASYAQCMSQKGEMVARVYHFPSLVTIGFLSSAGMGAAGVGGGHH
jgi:hypothetical protein